MLQVNLGKLEKLTIKAYEDIGRKKPKGSAFEAMINPENYTRQFQNVFSKRQGINSSGTEAEYARSLPEKLSLKIVLDGTGFNSFGILRSLPPVDVYTQVQQFLKTTGYRDGDIHEPRHLILSWGNFTFKCRLESVEINYSVFSKSGLPMKAVLDTEFFEDIKTDERLKKERSNSPDLTHYRIVKEGDQLPLMCKHIYGSPAYYLWVAKANNLKDIRRLTSGTKLFFPPIEK